MRRTIAPVARNSVYVLLAVLAIISIAGHFGAWAASSSITLNSSVQISFPTSMTFDIKAQGVVNITDLRLYYIVDRQNFASVVSESWLQFSPAKSVDAQWVWDMQKSPLPPGAQVEYWWTAEDGAGGTAQTDRATVSFEDDRYQWQSITAAPVTLLWYDGSRAFADALMAAAQQGLHRIENDTGAMPQGNVRIYIYASQQDLLSAQLFPPEYQGGVTFTSYNLIAIAVPTDQLAFGLGAVPHELTHWVVGQITFNPYGAGLPIWLDEGLATYGEGTLRADYQAALDSAIRNDQLISVRSLSSPFSAQQVYLSYGESNSIVTFLIEEYGKDKMVQLLDVFHRGAGYDEALEQVYGFDQDGLEQVWRQSLGIETAFVPQPEPVLVAG